MATRMIHGDLFDVLPTLDAASIDACVTDPPYGLEFMGVAWDTFSDRPKGKPRERNEWGDFGTREHPRKSSERGQIARKKALAYQRFSEAFAVEVLRVLKPGGFLVAFGAPRTYHRLVCGVEDAGFEIRDGLQWMFGSGFPKSLNLGSGRGTALKPGYEPIVLGMKATDGTFAENVEAHGTAALNIDACRIHGTVEEDDSEFYDDGRWPANVVLDQAAAEQLDAMTVGSLHSAGAARDGSTAKVASSYASTSYELPPNRNMRRLGDDGGASRFYYVAKPSREERDFGCDGLAARTGGEATDRKDGSAGLNNPRAGAGRTGGARNFHPTVKPVELMRWLVRLVTPPGGLVLDPFTGSGTTGMACRYEQRRFIGIEREADYVAIAERRIGAVAPLFSSEAPA